MDFQGKFLVNTSECIKLEKYKGISKENGLVHMRNYENLLLFFFSLICNSCCSGSLKNYIISR